MPTVRKYDPNYVGSVRNIKKYIPSLGGKLVYLRTNRDRVSGGVQSITEFEQKPNETVKQFNKRIKKLIYKSRQTARLKDVIPASNFQKTIRDWSNNWFKENFKAGAYGPRDSDKFLKNLATDWAKEVKEKGYKTIRQIDPSKGGYPNIFRSANYDSFKVGSFPIDNDLVKGERSIRKAFYANQLKVISF